MLFTKSPATVCKQLRTEQLVSLCLALEAWLRDVWILDTSCLCKLTCNDQNTFQNIDCCLNYHSTQAELATATQILNGAAFLPVPTSVGCIYSQVLPVYCPGGVNGGQQPPVLRGQDVTCSSYTTTTYFGVLGLG